MSPKGFCVKILVVSRWAFKSWMDQVGSNVINEWMHDDFMAKWSGRRQFGCRKAVRGYAAEGYIQTDAILSVTVSWLTWGEWFALPSCSRCHDYVSPWALVGRPQAKPLKPGAFLLLFYLLSPKYFITD